MAYNPQISPWSPQPSDYTAGQSWANAITNVGNSVAQGMQQWYQNDKQDSMTRSQVAGLLPQFADKLSNPEDKTLVEKFINHKTNYKDNGYLLGLFSTLKSQQEDQAKQQYLQAQTALLQQQQQAQARAAAHQQFLGNVASGAGQYMYRNNPNNNPLIVQAANLYRATGQVPTPDNLLDFASRQGQRPALKLGVIYGTDAKGNPTRTSVDENTGEPIGGASPINKNYLTPEEQGAAEYQKTMATGLAKRYETVTSAVKDHYNTIDTIDATLPLLISGQAKTGLGQETIDAVKRGFNQVLGTAAFDLSSQEFTKRNLADFALSAAQRMAGQGQISDGERRQLAEVVGKYGFSNEGNVKILQWMKAVEQREIDRANLYQQVQAQNGKITGSEDAAFYRSHPLAQYLGAVAAKTPSDIISEADKILMGDK